MLKAEKFYDVAQVRIQTAVYDDHKQQNDTLNGEYYCQRIIHNVLLMAAYAVWWQVSKTFANI